MNFFPEIRVLANRHFANLAKEVIMLRKTFVALVSVAALSLGSAAMAIVIVAVVMVPCRAPVPSLHRRSGHRATTDRAHIPNLRKKVHHDSATELDDLQA